MPCLEELKKVFFDYSSGAFYCEECKPYGAREINLLTFNTLLSLLSNSQTSLEGIDMSLRLLDFYMVNKCETTIKSLKELISLY